ncbi:porin family protein [Chitinophaga sp. CF418]|uniref:porin family protein n=1 Tax=Chitinophaga sp. CF418 TaxID=1855287 RepID=UPI000913C8BD|nr:porin family protein [Chitinophaga sp. CF418]SHN43323.1 Outer membrane protein beta-barrel domain-containing protein [Chitinophaga sp. CF418]
MKRVINQLVLCIPFFLMHNSFAQTHIDLGIKAGLSIPNLTSGDGDNPINRGYGSRLGPDVAVHAEFHLSKRFSIQPQFEYSSQGGKKNGNQAFAVPAEMEALFPPGQVPQYLYANYKSEAKINYLMLPILAKYHFHLPSRWDLYIAAGPFASVVVSAKNETSGTSEVYLDSGHQQALPIGAQSFDNTENIKDDLHRFNAGINGHIGLAYNLAKGNVFIEGGGNYGFINIQKDNVNGSNKTGAAVVVLGYAFRL